MSLIDDITNKILEKLDTVGKEDSDEIEETSTTAGVGGYQTPGAFTGGKKSNEKKRKKSAVNSTGYEIVEGGSLYKKMMSHMHAINEASYRDYKKDPTSTPAQKVNRSIVEVNKMLGEMERIIGHNVKLKVETGVDSSHFWKGTSKRFGKIGERLIRISNKLKELSQ